MGVFPARHLRLRQCRTLNVAADVSDAPPPPWPCARILILALAVETVGIQLQLVASPGNPVQPGIGVKVLPPFRENSTSTEAAPPMVQRIAVTTPTNNFSAPLGATTVTVGTISPAIVH